MPEIVKGLYLLRRKGPEHPLLLTLFLLGNGVLVGTVGVALVLAISLKSPSSKSPSLPHARYEIGRLNALGLGPPSAATSYETHERNAVDVPAVSVATMDAATMDAATMDAATMDAETMDAETMDAETMDAVDMDAETVDVAAVNLTSVDLTSVDLTAVDLTAVDLTEVDLTEVGVAADRLEPSRRAESPKVRIGPVER